MSAYKLLLCPFHIQGTCNYGDGCIYSHKPEESVPIPPEACVFHLRSFCIYGEQCRRAHLTIDEIISGHNSNLADTVPNKQDSEDERNDVADAGNTSTSSEIVSDTSTNNASKSYASAVLNTSEYDQNKASIPLCTYFESNGFCVYPHCTNIHGNYCDLCGLYSVHPYNQQLSDQHRTECIKAHEESMEISFAFQRSKDLTCAICLDVVLDKEPRKNRRFGILENCVHIYCIECIRTWRNAEEMDKKNKRNCPQCRVKSDFIIPSEYFYDDKQQKEKLIEDYKKAMGSKHCKHFKKGQGKCPFSGACFYKHEYPDGTKAELPKPSDKIKLNRLDITTLLMMDESFLEWEDDDFSFTDSNENEYGENYDSDDSSLIFEI